MQTQVFFKESKRFLLENKKRILLFTFLGAIIFAIFTAVSFMKYGNESLSKEAKNDEVNNFAEFSLYIEKQDWIPFNNNVLLEKIFFSENSVKEAELETGVEITDLLEAQEEQEFIPTGEDRGVIGVLRDVTNEAMVFQVKIGTEKENLEVANYYFDKIMNNEIELLNDKKIYVLSSPKIIELSQEEAAFIEEENSTTVSPLLLIIEFLISLFAGFLLGVLISIFYHVFNKKINYAFNYNINEEDIFLMERQSQDRLVYDVINPKNEEKIIIAEDLLPSKFLNKVTESSQSIITTTNLIEISPRLKIPEIVFVIVENSTTKSWYNTQREYLKRFDSKVKVVQVPESIFK